MARMVASAASSAAVPSRTSPTWLRPAATVVLPAGAGWFGSPIAGGCCPLGVMTASFQPDGVLGGALDARAAGSELWGRQAVDEGSSRHRYDDLSRGVAPFQVAD